MGIVHERQCMMYKEYLCDKCIKSLDRSQSRLKSENDKLLSNILGFNR